MKHAGTIAVLVGLLGVGIPARAWADATAFVGGETAPATRSARGFAIGLSLLVLGFEVEYGNAAEDQVSGAPGVTTGTFNGVVQTPTSKTQLYLTAGGGIYHATLGANSDTNFVTNIGGGVKLRLAGPIRLRLDYRVFTLRGASGTTATPQRFYAGLNLAF